MMARGWGRVIWISSQAGPVGIPGQSVCCAIKGAVNPFVLGKLPVGHVAQVEDVVR